jgi:outer membrane beta-barrel protein
MWIPFAALCLSLTPSVQAQSAPAAAAAPAAEATSVDPLTGTDGLVKTVQKKNFLKAGRAEGTIYFGNETINPFVRHWVVGVNGTVHLTEVFALEAVMGYSPSLRTIGEKMFGESPRTSDLDLRYLTVELENEGTVRPSTTKMRYYGHVGPVFSPLYGKFAFNGKNIVNFDIYFNSGLGFVRTQDLDENYLGEQITFPETTDQFHFATNLGFGFRGAFNKNVAFRLEGREYFFIEAVTIGNEEYSQQALNLVYYFMAQAGLSFFFF